MLSKIFSPPQRSSDNATGHSWRLAIARLEGAYSESTLRGYRADFAMFDDWCRRTKQSALPASPETVAAFIAADAAKSSPATLRRRLAGIRKIHRLLRLENPVEDEEVLIAMRRVLRTKPRRQKQAYVCVALTKWATGAARFVTAAE
jgi:site-specific recombinase XerD